MTEHISKQVDISIIIVNYETPQLIFECLQSIAEFSPQCSYEIIVVDNGSTGSIEEDILNRFSDVKFIETGENK